MLWHQSATIRNALAVILIQLIAIVGEVTGKVYDLDQVKELIDMGLPIVFNTLTLWFGWRAIKARLRATEAVQPPTLPWLKNKK